eukprot:SAG11_NODE_272_length_11319_cov_9.730481_1_plen_483_part_00
MHCHAAAAALRAAQTRTQWPERTTSTNMAARHFQSTTRPGQAVVTLDIVGGAAPDGPTAQSSLCFCCDPFAENVEYSRAAPAAASETSRMHRILSHVEPSSKVPRNLLVDGIPTAEIPWCRDVTAEAVAAAPRRQLATGFRSPPSAVLAPAAAESALGAAKQSAVDIIEAEAAELDALCLHIWNNPGLGYTEEEHLASEAICNFFESRGVEVERNYCGIKTAFRATLTTEGAAAEAGPTVAICCEFDALPGIGHACGHNLIAEATSAGFLGVKAALAEVTEAEAAVTAGTVVLIGTPAEEGGAGKVELIKRGGFADVDVAMMVHPGPGYTLYSGGNAMESVVLTYKGVNSHAAGAPWDGVNALNAVIQAFNNVDAMRQQMKPSWRVHGVIHEGGLKPNIIPDKCVAEWYIRALSVEDVAELRRKVEGCFKGAAISTGCELEMEWKADTAKTDFEAGCHMCARQQSNKRSSLAAESTTTDGLD